MSHICDFMMIIQLSIYILQVIKRDMGKLKTLIPIYCTEDDWENGLNLDTLDEMYMTSIL